MPRERKKTIFSNFLDRESRHGNDATNNRNRSSDDGERRVGFADLEQNDRGSGGGGGGGGYGDRGGGNDKNVDRGTVEYYGYAGASTSVRPGRESLFAMGLNAMKSTLGLNASVAGGDRYSPSHRRSELNRQDTLHHFGKFGRFRNDSQRDTFFSAYTGISSGSTTLEERLQQIVVFELREDGPSEYSTMTLRALYNYVVKTITEACREANEERAKDERRKKALLGGGGGGLGSVDEYGGINIDGDDMAQSNPSNHSNHSNHAQAAPSILKKHKRTDSNPHLRTSHTRERLGGYLHPRDMRRLVTPFSSSNEPQLIVRRHVMLLNFDPLRAIVLRDRLLVLVPDGADSILIDLEKRVRGGIVEIENQVFGVSGNGLSGAGGSSNSVGASSASTDVGGGVGVVTDTNGIAIKKKGSGGSDVISAVKKVINKQKSHGDDSPNEEPTELDDSETDTNINSSNHSNPDDAKSERSDTEWEDIQGMDWSQMPFELQSVDAVLQTVTSMLMDDAEKVHHRSVVSMAELRGESSERSNWGSGPGENAQERLRLHKDEVNLMEGRVQGFVRAMNDVLDDDEDMALMNLSRLLTHRERFVQPVPQEILHEESDEPELILEAYLQQALTIVNELELLKGQITTTEEQISMTLDALRNRLLYINTLLSVASLTISVGSFVGSIFGMNMTNHLETHPTAWARTTWGTVLGMFLLWVTVSWVFHRAVNTRYDMAKKFD